MDSVSPNIFVQDLTTTIEFYEKLDFKVITSVNADNGEMIFALMMNCTTTFMFQTIQSIESQLPCINRSKGGSLLLYIKMKGIRDYFEKVKEKISILHGLEKTFYSATEFSVVDPNNFMLTFAEDE